MLSDDERSLVRDFFSQGPASLIERGYAPSSIADFLAREDVRAEIQLLENEFRYQEPLKARSRFMVARNLNKLGPHTVAVLGQSLAGPVYLRDPKTGAVLTDKHGKPLVQQPAPTRNQLKAAEIVLERMGVKGDGVTINIGADTNLQQTFLKPQPKIESAPKLVFDPGLKSEKERAVSRERIRNAIERLRVKLPEAKAKVDAILRGGKKLKKPTDTVSKRG